MKRLCIYVTYDPENMVDDYIGYMLRELRALADCLLVVCNYDHIAKGIGNVEPYADQIFYRDNAGFDAGAYQEILRRIDQIDEYDEMILSNDTFFGPFVPLDSIFDKMESDPCDFWGLNRRHIPLHDFIASFFMVFRRRTIQPVTDYMCSCMPENMCREDVLRLFEQGISNELKRKGFHMGCYCDIAAVDMYRDPDYLINIMGSPVMKKRCFESGYYVEDNCRRALRYIKEKTVYDIALIQKTVERMYGIVCDNEYTDISESRPDERRGVFYSAPQCDLEAFFKKNPEVYLYGNGGTAGDFEEMYGDKVKIRGRIVSDRYAQDRSRGKNAVIPIRQVEDKKIPVIVTLSKENSREVAQFMKGFTNVFYLWRWKE